ncbi:MAG TPA: RNA-binding protein [Candidatus Krumholzibacteria bacterium]|nr:RNA-binding protein [Candidatus Krumholzibacteria bacterium]
MNRKLYVGNLNYATTEDDLRELFSEVGPVASVSLVTDRETGRPRGFGFVEMETDEAAAQAVEKLNNRELASRTLTVNIARPKTDSRGGGGGGRGGFGGGGGRGGYGGGGRDRY